MQAEYQRRKKVAQQILELDQARLVVKHRYTQASPSLLRTRSTGFSSAAFEDASVSSDAGSNEIQPLFETEISEVTVTRPTVWRTFLDLYGRILLTADPALLDERSKALLNCIGFSKKQDQSSYIAMRSLFLAAAVLLELSSSWANFPWVMNACGFVGLIVAWKLSGYFLPAIVEESRWKSATGMSCLQRAFAGFKAFAVAQGVIFYLLVSLLVPLTAAAVDTGVIVNFFGANSLTALPTYWSWVWTHAISDVEQSGFAIALFNSRWVDAIAVTLQANILAVSHCLLNKDLNKVQKLSWMTFLLASCVVPLPLVSLTYMYLHLRMIPPAARVCLAALLGCGSFLATFGWSTILLRFALGFVPFAPASAINLAQSTMLSVGCGVAFALVPLYIAVSFISTVRAYQTGIVLDDSETVPESRSKTFAGYGHDLVQFGASRFSGRQHLPLRGLLLLVIVQLLIGQFKGF